MTACVAALFTWQYKRDGSDPGYAALTCADRMLTSGNIEYEPNQYKACFLTSKVMLLMSGDVTAHSDALRIAQRKIKEKAEIDVATIAQIYADALTAIRVKEASHMYLSPLGLDLDSFLRQQHELSPTLIAELTNQLQNYYADVAEALVVGADEERAHIFLIDKKGNVRCQNDVGFAAIGSGAEHARSQFMSAQYSTKIPFANALGLSFVAKKNAQIAPGVGTTTDMFLVTRFGWEPIVYKVQDDLSQFYDDYKNGQQTLVLSMIGKINMSLVRHSQPMPPQERATPEETDKPENPDQPTDNA